MLMVSYNLVKNIFINLLLLIILFSIITPMASANEKIPKDLKKWESWVLKDKPSIKCPIIYNQNRNYCAYPSTLSIKMKKKSGSFKQVWNVYAESWITLPGDIKIWPKNVRVNQKSRPVVSHNNKPAMHLKKGRYSISGDFKWQQQPKSLSIPNETGLIELTIDNKKIKLPDFRSGKLWLKTSGTKSNQNNKLDVQVYRKITDTIPLRVTTHIKLDVSGQQREIILKGALLDDFIPAAINSRLPSQMDKEGNLKIQINPGQWTVDVTAFSTQQLSEIKLPDNEEKLWPDSEIWVLDQQPHLRLIKVTNKNSIDPNQTRLPLNWKALPAYNLLAGESITFDVLKRGNPEPEPDQLSLTKKIWLDFNGGGFTVNDRISGKLSRQWRLNASGMNLGQVTLNGKPQFITVNQKKQQGVEVRHGNLNLSADSRINKKTGTLSASGWDIDFSKVSATLYLPAGWKFMSLSGANSDRTWIKQWTLLDLFLVLITAIAVYKIFGMKWGTIALLTLILVWHEHGSPQYIWLNLIVAIAMLRVLPEGRFYKLMKNYRLISSIALVLIILPFVVNQVRTTLYPQLEFRNMSVSNNLYGVETKPELYDAYGNVPMVAMEPAPEAVMEEAEADYSSSRGIVKLKKLKLYSPLSSRFAQKPEAQRLQVKRIDPDAMIQTGPGLPSWTLHQFPIHWDGPVHKDQNISLILLSPAMHAMFKIAQLIFVLLLAWRLLEISSFKLPKIPMGGLTKASATGFILCLIFAVTPTPVEAEFPPQNLLNELQKELMKPSKCLPQCASIESMSINLSSKQLDISLRIHAHEDVLLPLPVPIKQWIPQKIRVDGNQTSGLVRKNDSTLWLRSTKGIHVVKISGRVDHLNQLQFSFPLKPHYISLKTKNWSSEGMEQESHKIRALTFLRIIDKKKSSKTNRNEQSEIPVYAEVTRSLQLGLDWYVTTHVRGISGTAYPVILNIPLLQTESVITDNINVKDNHVVVTLSKNKRSVSWTSKLNNSLQIKLRASKQKQYIEKWNLDASPVWHIDFKGPPVIYHQRQGNNWRPEWQPWPGEKVTIDVSRPIGISGKTLTIDSSTLTLSPGEQITAAKLAFNLRSSLGGQHAIYLPADADLQTVTINGQSMPIRNTKDGLSLPVSPGNQKIEIDWREPRGISTAFHSSKINMGSDSVNNAINIKPGYDRWVLFTKGPAMGPAILFWGMLIVITLIAYGLGRIKDSPLNSFQWILLGFGLSASGPWGLVVIAVCIFALRARGNLRVEKSSEMSKVKFNLMQTGLILLVLVSVGVLFSIIEQGLLGSPDMQITGNGSSYYQLNWFSDRIETTVPQTTMISVPVYVYRLMMLFWSIWLAFAVIKWAKWGWGSYTKDEYWRTRPDKKSDNKEDE